MSDPGSAVAFHSLPWRLFIRAVVLKVGARIAFAVQAYLNPGTPSPSRTIWIDSTLSSTHSGPRAVRLDIYSPLPNSYGLKRPCILVLHGGGFVLGSGTDDAPWAGLAMRSLGAVVIAVSYRLAPRYPYPIPVEDAADAILYVYREARTLGIDPDRIFLSGFSAGGSLAFASALLLQRPTIWSYNIPAERIPKIKGIVGFYPTLDWTIPRDAKRRSNPKPELSLPAWMTEVFDKSYLSSNPDRRDARCSPGQASDDLLEALPPVHLCLCEYDMLRREAEVFARRLEKMGKIVETRVVRGAKHGWDKPPQWKIDDTVWEEYRMAIVSMERWMAND